jgi:hypothetical protein
VRERLVLSLDGEHGVARIRPVALEEGVNGERTPIVGTRLQHGHRFIDATDERRLLGRELEDDARRESGSAECRASVCEGRVGVDTATDGLDRNLEDCGVEAFLSSWGPALGE